MINLLLLSNSTMPGAPFFEWASPWVQQFLPGDRGPLLFIPYAAVAISFDAYEERVGKAFSAMGYRISGSHRCTNPVEAVRSASGIVVGGGNSFALLARIRELGLLEAIRSKVLSGSPYIGWSAGANLACPTIMTTNDMPVVQPGSLAALQLIPFQINPHYHELKFENQGGETRRERLEEFILTNPDKKVIGLPEGMLLERRGNGLWLRGDGVAKLYEKGPVIRDLPSGSDLQALL